MGYWYEVLPRCHSTFGNEWNGCFFCGSKNLIGTALTSWPTWWGALVMAGWVCSVEVDSLMLRLGVKNHQGWGFVFHQKAPWCWVQIAAIDILRPNKRMTESIGMIPSIFRSEGLTVWQIWYIKENLGVISRAVIPLVELIGLIFVRHLVVPHPSGLIKKSDLPWKLVL